jgi:hypothetical protein
MNNEQKAVLDAVANERSGQLQPPPPAITLESLHARLTAVENHPALSVPALQPTEEESHG